MNGRTALGRDDAIGVHTRTFRHGARVTAAFWRSLQLATLVFTGSAGLQWLIYSELMNEGGSVRLIGPATAALVTGLLTYQLQISVSRQREAAERRLRSIVELNHHIRNALQVIAYETFIDGQRTVVLAEAIERIDWALKYLLVSFDREDLCANGKWNEDGERPSQN